MEKVCVLGTDSTEYGKLDDSIVDIATQASISAIEGTEVKPNQIEEHKFILLEKNVPRRRTLRSMGFVRRIQKTGFIGIQRLLKFSNKPEGGTV